MTERSKGKHLEKMSWKRLSVMVAFLLCAITDMQVWGHTFDICALCHTNATCDDKIDGSGKVCNCLYGFVGNGRTFCQDKDECQIGAYRICGQHTSCHNTYGSYYCTCLSGYSPSNNMAIFIPNDGTHCQDINECRVPGICGEGGLCRNLEGSFECHCLVGYQAHDGAVPFNPLKDKTTCKVVDCGQPPSVEDTVLLSATGTTYGSVSTFRCDDGFLWRSGDSSSVCGANGVWTGLTMVCEAKCGPVPVLANAEVVWHNMSVAVHRCVKGYHGWKGGDVSVCGATGIWQAATLRCKEIKPAIHELIVFKEKCLRWKAGKYEEDTEDYWVTYTGCRDYQRGFHDKRRHFLTSSSDQLELCLNLLPVTNYTISVTALSTKFTATVTANTSLQVPKAPVISYREVDTSIPTLTLHRSENTLDPLSSYQVFVVPIERNMVFDCTSTRNPDFSQRRSREQQYIAAQIGLTQVGTELNFTVGDGKSYGGFYNAPLQNGRDYYIIVRALTQWRGAFKSCCVLWAKVKGTPYIIRISSLCAAGSVALIAVVVFGGYSYSWILKFCKKP